MADVDDAPPSLPLFYKSLRPIDLERDASKRIRRNDYRFVASTNAIPVLIPEIPIAAASYPIIFIDGDVPIPIAVVGIRNDDNLFVDEAGKWRSLTYIPSYVQQYPFYVSHNNDNIVLYFDDTADIINESEGELLIEDGGPSNFLSAAIELCTRGAEIRILGEGFVRELIRFDLLETQAVQIPFSDGTSIHLGGWLTISSEKFDALPDSVLIEWQRRGITALVHAIFFSHSRWEYLAALHGEREGSTPVGSTRTITAEETSASSPESGEKRQPSRGSFRLSKRPGFGGQF